MRDCIKIHINGKEYKIEYSRTKNYHVLGLNNRPFQAMKKYDKKVEYRTNTPNSSFNFKNIKLDDQIEFINETNGESIFAEISRISHYSTTRELFENEGLENSSSKPNTIDQAITSLESHTGYKEGIMQFGIWAIGVDLIDKKF